MQLARILQNLQSVGMSDPKSPGLFDRSQDTVLHLTKREAKNLQRAESDFNTAIASCRSLVPDQIECAFSKVEAELVLMLSPVGTDGSLLDDDSCYLLLEYAFAELSIVLTAAIRPPKFMLPSPEYAVNKTMDSIKARLKVEASLKLTEYFPHSERIKKFQDGQNIDPPKRLLWMQSMRASRNKSINS